MSDPFIALWLLVLIASVVVEAATVSMVSIWFAAGALVSLIMAYIGLDIYVQIAAFLVVSVLLIALIMPRVKAKFTKSRKATNADRIIGAQGVVTAEIDNTLGTGQIKVLGNTWSAKSADGERIPIDTPVVIKNIEGVKAIVKAVE